MRDRLDCLLSDAIKSCHLKLEKMDQEVLDARAKLAAKYGKSTQVGGKGT